MAEFQITQEYTGQQKHLCYLVPQWKEVLDFDTFARGKGSEVKKIVAGETYPYAHSGMAAVINVGDDPNWTGHTLAQANLYGFGRLAWNPDLSEEAITAEWIRLTFGKDEKVYQVLRSMLAESWRVYESYTSPLGIGWMVNPGHHYGPNVDGYEYSVWGTYHYADCRGMGVNRTVKDGTGYTAQYFPENMERYESPETCPDELLLFSITCRTPRRCIQAKRSFNIFMTATSKEWKAWRLSSNVGKDSKGESMRNAMHR